jgi:hypothetical protein
MRKQRTNLKRIDGISRVQCEGSISLDFFGRRNERGSLIEDEYRGAMMATNGT